MLVLLHQNVIEGICLNCSEAVKIKFSSRFRDFSDIFVFRTSKNDLLSKCEKQPRISNDLDFYGAPPIEPCNHQDQ